MLNVSVKTADLDRRQIMSKLNISTTSELVKFSLRIGLTTLNPERKAHKNS
jgi:DNA-binding NarL/FixJ family response regulator